MDLVAHCPVIGALLDGKVIVNAGATDALYKGIEFIQRLFAGNEVHRTHRSGASR